MILFSEPTVLLTPVLAASFGAVLFALVLTKMRRSVTHRYFGLFLLGITIWSLLDFLLRASPTAERAFFWAVLDVAVALSVAPAFYFFARAYTGTVMGHRLQLAAFGYLIIVALFGWQGMLTEGIRVVSYGWAPAFAPTLYPVAAVAYTWVAAGVVLLYRAYRNSRVFEERNRLLYIVLATTFPILGTLFDLFFLPVYPTAILGNVVFGAITAFAIRRYHLLDISLVLRKGLAYLIMSALVAIPYVSSIYLATQVFGSDELTPIFNFLLVLALAFVLQPMWSQVQIVVDRFFYRQRWDSFRALEEFTKRSHSIAELNRPADELVKVIQNAVQADRVMLLLANDAGDFEPVATAGKTPVAAFRVWRSSLLISWMEREQRPVERRGLHLDPQLQALSSAEIDALESAGVAMLIPLRMRDRLSGILALGSKLADIPYSRDELTLLTVVAAQTAVLLDDARLYENLSSQLELGRRRLAAFQEAAAKLALEGDDERALQDLVETAKGLIDAESVNLTLYHADGTTDKHFASGSHAAGDAATTGPARHGLAGAPSTQESGSEATRPRTTVTVRFESREGGWGALVGRKGTGRTFSEDDERILSLFGVLAQVLLQNMSLYREVTQERSTLAAIQSSMLEGLLVINPEGVIGYCNEAAVQMMGLDRSGGVGRPALDVLTERAPAMEEPDRLKALLEMLASPHRPLEPITLRFLDPQPVDLIAVPFEIPAGPDHRMIGILFRDITQERDLERRRNEFVSIASHELRTPLSTLLGFSELLLSRGGDPSARRNWLEFIHRDSLRLTAIVDDLLNVSRIQAGRVEVKATAVALQKVVAEVVEGVKSVDPQHRFVVRGLDRPVLVRADQDKLTQVLTNLLSNASKYGGETGDVTITVMADPDASEVTVSVADKGIGIAPADQERLFTTFHRIDRPETRGIRGSGLGLYIVKSFVEMMGGRIWLESELNRGSTFFFSIPLADAASAGNGDSRTVRPRLVGRNIITP